MWPIFFFKLNFSKSIIEVLVILNDITFLHSRGFYSKNPLAVFVLVHVHKINRIRPNALQSIDRQYTFPLMASIVMSFVVYP